MSSDKTYDEEAGQIQPTEIESTWKQLRDHLENEKRRIMEEIVNYPPPIPACDVQFNFLLEERARIAQELNRLEAQRVRNI
jgi:hypothetical protein